MLTGYDRTDFFLKKHRSFLNFSFNHSLNYLNYFSKMFKKCYFIIFVITTFKLNLYFMIFIFTGTYKI